MLSTDHDDEARYFESRHKKKVISGHRIEEHLIVLRNFIQRRIEMKEGVVIPLVDYRKLFDSERLRAVMTSLNTANVNQKAYRCWFKLNATTVISEDTPVGRTEKEDVHEEEEELP